MRRSLPPALAVFEPKPPQADSEFLARALRRLGSLRHWEPERIDALVRDVGEAGIGSAWPGSLGLVFRFLGRRSLRELPPAGCVLKALQQLPLDARRVCILRYYCDWPVDMIADELGNTPRGVTALVESSLIRIARDCRAGGVEESRSGASAAT